MSDEAAGTNKASKRTTDRMLTAVAKFLEENDWKVAVIGEPKIEKPIEYNTHVYQFVLRFTGVKKGGES